MGGKLSIKKGCGAGDSKKNKATAEAADNPDVKQSDQPKEDSPQTQPKAADSPAENASENEKSAAGEKSADLVVLDSKTEKPIADVTASQPRDVQDLASGSDVQEKSNSANVVVPEEKNSDASTEEPESSTAPALRAEVQETSIEIQVASVTKEAVQTSSAASVIPATPVKETTVAEISADQKPSLSSPTATHPIEDANNMENVHPEKDSFANLETKVKDCEETPNSGQRDVISESKLFGEQENMSLETTDKETGSSFTQGLEPEVQCVITDKGAEIPTLDMAEETPIDLVLKNEMAKCPDLLEKNVIETPQTPAEAPEKVESEPAHSVQVVAPDVKTQQSPEHPKELADVQGSTGNVTIPEDQLPEGSVESKEDCGQTRKDVAEPIQEDKLSSDPVMAEPTQTVSSPKAEELISIPTHDHTVTKTVLPDSTAEISLLKTSSELIPDIKLTVYTEVFEEEKVESHYEEPSHKVPTPEEIPPKAVNAGSDMKTDSNPLNEAIVEPESVGSEAIVQEGKTDAQETKESFDQLATKSELTDPSCAGPEPSSPRQLVNSTEEHKETNSATTDNGVTLDSEEKGEKESTSETVNVQETSIVNGTSADSGKNDAGKAEENRQEISSDKLGMKPMVECEITEELDKVVGEQECGLVKLDN
ncbi:titin-like [Callorhinchus milii]|uniref:titin-like n=1 Tax=Callorhinchus milii TaxID=7868 RepID=UPI001C3F65AF|nr:titin-like [Callorhinchus milii]